MHKLTEVNGEWHCDCNKFKELRNYHPEPICVHTVAVEKILREKNPEEIYWLYQPWPREAIPSPVLT